MANLDDTDRLLIAVIAILVIAVMVVELIPAPVVTGIGTNVGTFAQTPKELNTGTVASVQVMRPFGTTTMATVNIIGG